MSPDEQKGLLDQALAARRELRELGVETIEEQLNEAVRLHIEAVAKIQAFSKAIRRMDPTFDYDKKQWSVERQRFRAAQQVINDLTDQVLDDQKKMAVPQVWLPKPSPLDDHEAHIRAHMAYAQEQQRILIAGNQCGKLTSSRLSPPEDWPDIKSLRAETVKDLLGLISPDQVHGLMSMTPDAVVQPRKGYQRFEATIIGGCPGHEHVETGMRKSWCKHCNANMVMDQDGWKVVP